MAAKDNGKEAVAAPPASGKGGGEKEAKPSSSGLQAVHVLTAAIFLALGVLTPPLVSFWQSTGSNSRSASSSNDPSSSSKATEGRRNLEEEEESTPPPPLPIRTECSKDNLSGFLHEEPIPGMHVACLDGGRSSSKSLSVRFFPGAHASPSSEDPIPMKDGGGGTWREVRELLEVKLDLAESGPYQRPFAIFTPRGERLVGADDDLRGADDEEGGETTEGEVEELIFQSLVRSGMIVIMEGGAWIWPPVRIGFKRSVDLYNVMPGPPGTTAVGGGGGDDDKNRTVVIETLSIRPIVVSVDGFISAEECEYIQEQARPKVKYSGVVLMDKDKGKEASEWRTSQSTFLHASQSMPTLLDIEQRTASLTRIPRKHQEDVQVLRYGLKEKYDAHHDFFNPDLYRGSPETLRLIENGRRNRIATVFWYLSDVEKGGETNFPRFNGAPQPRDFTDCTKGLKVKPELGKVIIFYDLHANGRMDELSLHGGCPVEEGIKWAANKWVWNAPMNYVRDM